MLSDYKPFLISMSFVGFKAFGMYLTMFFIYLSIYDLPYQVSDFMVYKELSGFPNRGVICNLANVLLPSYHESFSYFSTSHAKIMWALQAQPWTNGFESIAFVSRGFIFKTFNQQEH